MIRFWDVAAACVETESEADRYAATLRSRVERLCFWMWWYCEMAVLGYDQWQRWDIRVGGESDCSSLTYWCLWKAGYLAKPVGNLYDYTLYTGSIRRDLVAAGWTVKPVDGNPRDGWVLLNDGHHVAVWIGNGLLAQSSIDERGKATGGQSGDQTGRETNTKGYYNYPWSCYLCPPPDPAPPRKTKRPTGGETGARGGEVYRLYNAANGMHLFTMDANEYATLPKSGWSQEGVAWTAPASGDKVYRLLNPATGEHHYTAGLHEAQTLWDLGWEFEGLSWYSGGGTAVWRLYNPSDGRHFYTTSNLEHARCVEAGWRQEGVAFWAMK